MVMAAQLTLDDILPPFRGLTYEPQKDKARLSGQLERVRKFMSDGQYHTLREISEAAQGSEASVSARLRDLRRIRFGGHLVDRKRISGGLYAYRVRSLSSC